jgi:hypothetical protein
MLAGLIRRWEHSYRFHDLARRANFSKFGTNGQLWTDAAPNFLIFGIVALGKRLTA